MAEALVGTGMSASGPRRYVAVKRKANEEPAIDWKRFKLVGSCQSADKEQLRQCVLDSSPMMIDAEFEVEDYEEFVLKVKEDCFPKKNEVVTCNGIPLVPVEALSLVSRVPPKRKEGDEEEDSEAAYVYDVYWYNVEKDQLVNETYREDQEVYDDECSSNDENYPDNDYPDEDDLYPSYPQGRRGLDDDQEYWRDWEEDDRQFRRFVLNDDNDYDDRSDEYGDDDEDY